jgi:hypothetical protein
MQSLREWQRDFMRALTADARTLPDHLHAQDAHGARLAIYRNNWRSNLTQALRLAYPVVECLVGREFFDYCARCFIEVNPSRAANLDEYGHAFAEFLRTFAPAATLPYLGDVAALESALDTVAAAPDAAAQIRINSACPILKIWQSNQPDWSGETTINLDEGPDNLLIRREHGEVVIESLAAADNKMMES